MNYDKLWYIKLKEQAKTDFKMFKKINKNKFYSIADKYMKDKKHVKFVIKDNKLKIEYDDEIWSRIESAEKFINGLLTYVIKNNLDSIDGEYIMRLGDSCDLNSKIPIFTYSKPKNIKGFLFPDFNLNLLDEKKITFQNKCSNVIKKDIIYFKGNPTSRKKTKIREKLEPFTNDILKVDLQKTDYRPYYEICNYKYVLDLPGNFPWSVRLIELYLSKSLPFRVNFYYVDSYKEKNYKYDQWIQFYESMFPEDISYINFKYENSFYTEITDEKTEKIKNDLINKFHYFESNPDLYNKIVNENYKKSNALTFEHIYYYLYEIFSYYKKLTNQQD